MQPLAALSASTILPQVISDNRLAPAPFLFYMGTLAITTFLTQLTVFARTPSTNTIGRSTS